MRPTWFIIGFILLSISPFLTNAQLIPPDSNDFYYHIGGGQDIPQPAYMDTHTVPLSAEGNVGLNYDCGLFNPATSIINSLNSIKNSFQNIKQSVISNATAAIAEFPMYILARANPTLYDLLNNALLGARKDLTISTKDCQVMQNAIATGHNPYDNWAMVSVGDDWKYHMSLAPLTDDPNDADINQVKSTIQNDNGKQGVPWVQGINAHGGLHAGGEGQPPIYVIHDTAIAGYNVILQAGRRYNDISAPAKTSANTHLVATWSDPISAAKWIVNVVGDQKVTTYSQGSKDSTPGVGLLPQTQHLTQTITQKLTNLVTGKTTITLTELHSISAPRVMINTAVVNAIRQQPPVMRTILINKLSQEVATARVIDMALLARQILQESSQVPTIYANDSAQAIIEKASQRLDKAINNLLFNVRVNKLLVSNTVTELMRITKLQQQSRTQIHTNSSFKALDKGAIKTKEDQQL